jgi:hypothetical protein
MRLRPILVATTIALGVAACGSTQDDAALFVGQYHPDGFAAGELHGPSMELGQDDCRGCHGEALEGHAEAPSCDVAGCHGDRPRAWRRQCTFCHGGDLNDSGAPPSALGDDVPFVAHTAHIQAGFACTECHVKAVDVLSPGHVFDDDTPGVSEVDLGAGRSPRGRYDGAGCTSTYCHGDGRDDDGTIAKDAGPRGCTSCHAGVGSAPDALDAMSGAHRAHLEGGIGCASCHAGVADDGLGLTDGSRHVDGARDVLLAEPTIGFDPVLARCTGACHGTAHDGSRWTDDGGRFHPAGFAKPAAHGTEMVRQRQDCRGCHGDDLTGGSGPSCDGCHTAGWRRDCTYCHGGGLNLTGAPPGDLGAADRSIAQSFVAHTRHVTEGIARASTCGECHRQPADVLSPGHAFDDTPGVAEVDFAGGLSPAARYDGDGGCAEVACHGDGRGDGGDAIDGMPRPSCASCHPRRGMSPEHVLHHGDFACQTCHADVTADGATILAPMLHVDGAVQVRLSVAAMAWAPTTARCDGVCHAAEHAGVAWRPAAGEP